MSDPSLNNHFVDYTTLYYSPTELLLSNSGVDITQAYTNSLFTGTSATPNANMQQYLPGNRYFLDTQSTCTDSCGNSQELSTLVDNVISSVLANPQQQGLMYSLLTVLQSINPLASVADSSLCLPVSVYINGSNSGQTTTGWVSSTERIDPQAIDTDSVIPNTISTSPATTTPSISGFCSNASCKEDPLTDTIVQMYLLGLIVVSGFLVYRACIRK
jgi:hypothetical protein